MDGTARIADVLKRGGFGVHHYVGRLFGVRFIAQSLLIPIISAGLIVAGSLLDGTLAMPGRDVGLFEHPAIWAFLLLQIALPLWLRDSLQRIATAESFAVELTRSLDHFLKLKDRASRLIAAACYLTGLIAFIWNTYQNQLPGVIVPYDFWDSSNHAFGYWVTRVYKLYLFVWLFPYVAVIHAGVLYATLRTIRQRRVRGVLKLSLFHPDDVGGLGFVPGLITTPIIITILAASLPLAGAFYVHRAFDVTPVMGCIVLVTGALVAYAVPVLHLRTDLLVMKRETVEKLRLLQQTYYTKISQRKNPDFDAVQQGNEALEYFERVCARVQSISNYPHLARLLKFLGLALTPSVLLLAVNSYRALSPLIGLILKPA